MIRIAAALLGILTWCLASFFSIRYPLLDSLGSGSFAAAWAWGWLLVVAGVVGYAFWLGHNELREKRLSSGMTILLSLGFQVGLVTVAAIFIHRDFISLYFQALAIHYALFLDITPRYRSRNYLRLADKLFTFTLCIIVFFLFWIGLMGYAIATRSEPRWIPSIAYNVLNLAICAFLGLASFNLRDRSRRELLVTEDALLLDGLDVLQLFSPSARPLALCFAGQSEPPRDCRRPDFLRGYGYGQGNEVLTGST